METNDDGEHKKNQKEGAEAPIYAEKRSSLSKAALTRSNGASSTSDIPASAWSRRLSNEFPDHKSFGIKFFDGLKLATLAWRMYKYIKQEKSELRTPIFDPFNPPKAGPLMGVPVGGIGSGSIGRGWRGDFMRWQVAPTGIAEFNNVEVDQFSVYIKRPLKGQKEDSKKISSVLHAGKPPGDSGVLDSWDWKVTGDKSTYYALFPRAWTIYEEPDPTIRLTCMQISPVIPHNYKETSFPVGNFEWTVENLGDTEAEVSIMFTFQNGTPSPTTTAGGHVNKVFHKKRDESTHYAGVIMQHKLRQIVRKKVDGETTDETYEDPLSFSIATIEGEGVQVTSLPTFCTNSKESCKALWDDFSEDGMLTSDSKEIQEESVEGKSIGSALACKIKVAPGEKKKIVFALGWDAPIARFASGNGYKKRYTKFYGDSGNAVEKIVCDALDHYKEWEKLIVQSQSSILNDEALPDFYKGALFNELYYLVDGGTVWTNDHPVGTSCFNDRRKSSEVEGKEEEIGHFAYLEGIEYLMYNTYDVHFYASFALIMLWPKLELSLQRDIAAATMQEYSDKWVLSHSGKVAPRKLKGAVPHDIGNPGEDPWVKVNSYNIQDVTRWKDLPCKLILQLYRDYYFTKDKKFLEQLFPVIVATIDYALAFDTDGDGVIDNEGFPDQTYDIWSVKGCSAYSGGLWLACLTAAIEIAKLLGENELVSKYSEILTRGKKSYNEKLWNGKYYNYDSSNSRHHKSIMADQICGQWYAKACGLPSIIPEENAETALKTVYEFNVMNYFDGTRGAVNGMTPNGKPDSTAFQASEVWTGTTYALAATMLQEGLTEEAFVTAKGVIESTYEVFGYHFQTPEAWDVKGNYRSCAYMRPLSIWAMQWAWNNFYASKENNNNANNNANNNSDNKNNH